MKKFGRKVFAWSMVLVMLASMLAVPALADGEEGSAPAAAPVAEAPVQEEAPVKEEAPAVQEEAPAEEEAPAVQEEAPAEEEAPTVQEEAPAEEEAPAAEEAPAKEEVPAAEETPAEEEVPVEAAPAEEESPAQEEVPAEEEEAPAEAAGPVITLFSAPSRFEVDWDQVELLPAESYSSVRWAVVQGDAGYYFYFEGGAYDGGAVAVYYDSAPDTWASQVAYYGWNAENALGPNNSVLEDAVVTTQLNANGDQRSTEIYLPAEHFTSQDFTLKLGDTVVHSGDVPLKPGQTESDLPTARAGDEPGETQEPEPSPAPTLDAEAAYTGIVIDGDFSDWDAVPKYDANENKGYDTVDQMAVVWDGDMVYVLLVAAGSRDAQGNPLGYGNWTSVTGAGPSNNGQYAIVTDLNNQLLVQPTAVNNVPGIAGIPDAQVAVNTTEYFKAPFMWEIAFSADLLPSYLESFDFGLYLMDPTVKGVTNLRGGEEDKTFNGIVFDGNIQDWTYYPETTIEYAGTGTQDVVRDSHGALWADGSTLYGYAATNMEAHLAEQGSCFLGAISLAFNGDRNYKALPHDGNFYPRIVSFDSGSPVVVNDGTYLENGDYTFYIYDTRTEPTAPVYDPETNTTYYPTVDDMKANAFGQIKVHVDGVLDYAEFELDLERVAEYIDQDASTAFKTVEIQWGRLGQQWITYSGTPTGPVLGVALAVGAVAAPVGYQELKKRRGAKRDQTDAQDK